MSALNPLVLFYALGKVLSATKLDLHDNMTPGNPKKYHSWKVGQINIQTCSDDLRLDFALQECSQANLDIVCFQEVRRLKVGNTSHLGYNFYWCGMKRYRRNGVAIAIRNCSDIVLDSIHNVNDRLMAADITVHGFKLRIISCYAPTLDGSALTTKEIFYRNLVKLSKTDDKDRKVLIQGDFNAEMNICREHSCFDGRTTTSDEGLNQSNENCRLFLNHCQTNQLSILNTWFSHPIHHRTTWHCPRGPKKVYDYSLSGSWLRKFVQDVRVRNSYFNSDHKLVVTKLVTPANKAARVLKRTRGAIKPNLQLLQDNLEQTTYTNVQNTMAESINSGPTLISENIQLHQYLIDTMMKGRQKIPPKPQQQNTLPWNYDEELSTLITNRKHLRKQANTTFNQNKIKGLNKKIKLKVKRIRNELLKDKAKNINLAKEQRKVTKLWKNAKNHGKEIFHKPKPIQCPGLSTFFEEHFNPDQSSLTTPVEIQHLPPYIESLRQLNPEINQDPPTQDEISNGIKQLNTGKATIDVEAEILQCADSIPQFRNHLEEYFRQIWSSAEVPEQWRLSGMTPIWKKKGSASDPTKYRGLSIGSTLCKVGVNIILKRTSSFYENHLKSNQFGFRSGVGCNDAIYVIKQLHEIASLSERKLYVCFIDLSSAFDHVNRKLLFQSIRNRLPDDRNFDILENLYSDTRAYVRDQQKRIFPTKSGVRQGGTEGPPLYNMFSDYSLRVYHDRKAEAEVTGLNIPYQIPQEATNREQRMHAPTSGVSDDDDAGYADDLALFAWNPEELQTCVHILVKVFEEFGLQINQTKTETMIMNSTNPPPASILSINGKNIKNVSAFKYLGVWITCDTLHIGNEELDHRINSAHNAFSEHRSLLTNMNIALSTRIQFFNAFVRTRLTYGCHCWRPSAPELSKIQSAHHYFLRCMIYNGHKRVNPPTSTSDSQSSSNDSEEENDIDWRYMISNERIFQIAKTQTIKNYYEQQQQNFTSHIIRRKNNSTTKKLMFHNVPNTKRGRKSPSILERVINRAGVEKSEFIKLSFCKQNPLLSSLRL